MKWAFYNEIDPYCAEWLRNLIRRGQIAPGYVDERSIVDVKPDDLREFCQCHFFCGIAGWPLAFRAAGVPDSWAWWSGSAPCQPFSAAGKGGGFADERHLWPAFDWLIGQRRPDVCFGEQVEGPAGRAWLDLVLTDLEGHGYACGAEVFPAASVGAPHGRHRTYWCATLAESSRQRRRVDSGSSRRGQSAVDGRCKIDGVADAAGRLAGDGDLQRSGQHGLQPQGGRTEFMADDDDEGLEGRIGATERQAQRTAGTRGVAGELADSAGSRHIGTFGNAKGNSRDEAWLRLLGEIGGPDELGDAERAGLERLTGSGGDGERIVRSESAERYGADDKRSCEINEPWRNADWLFCRDGKWRPVEPGTQPLATGIPARVGKLRAYGNSIVPQQAALFIQAFLEAREDIRRPVRIDDLFG